MGVMGLNMILEIKKNTKILRKVSRKKSSKKKIQDEENNI